MLIAMLDALGQAHSRWHHERRASTLSRAKGLTIGPSQDRCIAAPPITTPAPSHVPVCVQR
jgi:hypothetical protein